MSIINPKAKKNLGRDLKFQVTKVPVFIWIGKEKIANHAFAFLSDIKKKGLTAFFNRKLPLRELVLVAFEKENNQPFQMKVISNRSIGDNNPSANRAGYSWKCSFVLGSASEQELNRYLAYYENLRDSIAALAKDVKQPEYRIKVGEGDAGSGDLNIPGLDGIDPTAPAAPAEAAPAEAAPVESTAPAEPAAEKPAATEDSSDSDKKDAA